MEEGELDGGERADEAAEGGVGVRLVALVCGCAREGFGHEGEVGRGGEAAAFVVGGDAGALLQVVAEEEEAGVGAAGAAVGDVGVVAVAQGEGGGGRG